MTLISNQLLQDIKDYAKCSEKKERYEHSLRVADTIKSLCKRFGLDEQKGYLAGLSHDICKNMDKQELKLLVASHNVEITELEEKNPGLLHGKGAAIVLTERFGYTDNDVLEAVANHTTGKSGLCNLGKCLFIADRLEPGRSHIDDEYRKSFDQLDINQTCLKLLQDSMEYLRKVGAEIAPITYEYEAYLLNEINGGTK